MREKIKVIRYVAVLMLTIFIFVMGILIGGDVEQFRVQNLYTQLQQQDLDYQNVVTEGNYIDYIVGLKENSEENISCDFLKETYFDSITNLDDSRLKLEAYINTAQVKEEEYQRLKEHYSNLQINYWLLANRISNLCDRNLNTILYFYSEDKKECPACEDQGIHLTYVKQKLKDNILIFSLNFQDIKGPVALISKSYQISDMELPVLVINGEVYSYSTNQEIFNILSSNQ